MLFWISISLIEYIKLEFNLNYELWIGENHVIFNFYSGTWPDYDNYYDELSATKAIIAKASFHLAYYRKNFDVSFPLFHPELPYIDNNENNKWQGSLENKRYLVTFKGKRYLNGIGSEARTSLHHLNNNRDVLVLTTCRHGLNWMDLKDKRCDADEEQYEK